MADLRAALSEEFDDVATYIQSGNVVLTSDLAAQRVAARVEAVLPDTFALDSAVRVLALDSPTYSAVVAGAPAGFGNEAEAYRYDVGFYLDVTADDVAPHVPTHPDVDVVTFGEHAYYHRRFNALASRSKVTKVVGSPVYGSLTVRNWRTTLTLAAMLDDDRGGRATGSAPSVTVQASITPGRGGTHRRRPRSPSRRRRAVRRRRNGRGSPGCTASRGPPAWRDARRAPRRRP